MHCSRCQGLMIVDHFLDFWGSFGEMWTTSWRCVNCGRIHDSVVEQNQLARHKKGVARPSGAPDHQEDKVPLGAESLTRHAA